MNISRYILLLFQLDFFLPTHLSILGWFDTAIQTKYLELLCNPSQFTDYIK